MDERPSYAVVTTRARRPLFPNGRPLVGDLLIELTERCNNACIHCYINLPQEDADACRRELSTAEWKQVLAEAASLGCLEVLITGGEPLLRPDFAELYEYIRRLGIKVDLYTNARLITPELADLFVRLPPLGRIEITVYGMRSETYDRTACAPGAYAEFRRGVNLLLERGVPFRVRSIVVPGGEEDRREFEAWAKTLPGEQDPFPYSMHYFLRGRRDAPTRSRLIERLRVTPQQGVALLSRDPRAFFEDQRNFCRRLDGAAPGENLFDCGAGKSMAVDAYGMCQPCQLLRAPELCYDLHQGTLRDALTRFFPSVLQRRAADPAYLARCARCFLKEFCEQCPAKAWIEHGTLDTPVEYYCQVTHAQARYLGLLAEGERSWEVSDGLQRIQKFTAEGPSI